MAIHIEKGTTQDPTAYMTSSAATSGLISNVLNSTGQEKFKNGTVKPVISCDIFKTAYPYNNWLRSFVEPNAGAHYYAYSPFGATYSKASIQIPLSEATVSGLSYKIENNRAINRRACISMGLLRDEANVSVKGAFDIGIVRDAKRGGGWYPKCSIPTNSALTVTLENVVISDTESCIYLSSTGTLVIEYSVGCTGTTSSSKESLKCIFKVDGAKVASLEATCLRGKMFTYPSATATTPNVSFVRFMSLIPLSNNGATDDADKTALSAALHDVSLYTTSGTKVVWDASKIQHAWVMQKNNAPRVCISNIRSGTETIGAAYDYANLYHQYQTH